MTYQFECNWQSGFVPDPHKTDRIGYLTDFDGLGLGGALAKDLTLYYPHGGVADPTYAPLGHPSDGKVSVTAVIDSLEWEGGAGDALQFSCYMSKENAARLMALTRTTLKTPAITTLGWWITNYDREQKHWFEEIYPAQPAKPAAQLYINGKDVRLHVSDQPVKPAPNIVEGVYNVFFEVVPAANQVAVLHIARDAANKVMLKWGLAPH